MENPVPGPAFMQQHSKAHKNLAIKGERLNAPSVHSHNSVTTDQSAHDSQTSITNLDNAPLKMELKEIPNDKTRKLSDIKILTLNDFIQSSLLLPSFLETQISEEPNTKIKRTLEFLFGVPFFKIQDNEEADFYCRHFNTKCCIVREHLLFAKGCYDPSSDEGMNLISCAIISFLNAHPEFKKTSEGLVKKHKSEIQAELMNELPLFGLIDEGLDQWKKAKEESKGFDHFWMLIFNCINDASKRGEESRNAFKMFEIAALQDKIETGSKLENGWNFRNEFNKQTGTTYKKKELEDANTNILWMLVVVPLSRLLNDKDTPPYQLFTFDDNLWRYRVRYQNYIDQLEEGVKDAHSDNPDFHLRESLSRIQTRINKVNEDKEEYLNPDYYTKWRDNYTKLCEQLSKERDHAEKNSKDSLVKGYGEKYGGVYHDIQDNIQNGKIAGFLTELAISIAAGGAASMLAKGFMKAAGKSVLRTLVGQAGVDIVTNVAVAEKGQAWAIISDVTMNDDVKMNGDYWLKQLKTGWDNTVSSTVLGMASAGIGTAIGLHSRKLHRKNSEIAPDSPAVKAPTPPPLPAAATKATGKAPTPPPLPAAATKATGKAPVKAETHTHTTSSPSAATESVEGTRIVQQSDHADIDDWLYRTRNDDRIDQLSDYQNPKLNNGSGTSATNSAAVNTQNPPPLPTAYTAKTPPPLPAAATKATGKAPTPPPLPAAATKATGKAPVKAETHTHTTSSPSAATESVEGTRIVQQSDHADIDDWLYRTRNDDRIDQLSDYQNPKLNNGSGTSATNSAAVNTQTPPPLPAAAKEATGKAPVKAETHTHTTSSPSAATESVEGTRIVQQSDHADIDDWLYRTRNDDRIDQLSDYQNPKLNNGSGTSATNSAAVNTQNPPPLPAAAKKATGKAPVKAETHTHISKWLADIKKAKNKERPIRLLTGNWALLKKIMDPAPVTSFIVIANRLLPSPTNEPPKPDPYFIDRYKKMIEPLKDKTNRADNSEDKNEDAEVSD